MAFQLYNDSPSLMKPGVYQSGSITEDQIGLNTIDLEKYSFGNWNSIIYFLPLGFLIKIKKYHLVVVMMPIVLIFPVL